MSYNQQPYFTIGKETSEFLKVEVLNYERAEDSDYWDGNWIRAKVSIKAGGFSGNYVAQLQTTEFNNFEKELNRIYNDLNGITQFYSLEDWIIIKLIGDGIGHFKVECTACDFPGTGNTLEFELEIDQTEIPNLILQIKNILEIFPVKGSPKMQ